MFSGPASVDMAFIDQLLQDAIANILTHHGTCQQIQVNPRLYQCPRAASKVLA